MHEEKDSRYTLVKAYGPKKANPLPKKKLTVKSKSKGRSRTQKRLCEIQKEADSLDEALEKALLLRRGPFEPLLNKADVPERDIGMHVPGDDLRTPYNQRLPSSTPQHMSPVKLQDTLEQILKGNEDEHALNSLCFTKQFHPGTSDHAPLLTPGNIHMAFQSGPTEGDTPTDQQRDLRDVFLQLFMKNPELQSKCVELMLNSVHAQNNGATETIDKQYSLYSDKDKDSTLVEGNCVEPETDATMEKRRASTGQNPTPFPVFVEHIAMKPYQVDKRSVAYGDTLSSLDNGVLSRNQSQYCKEVHEGEKRVPILPVCPGDWIKDVQISTRPARKSTWNGVTNSMLIPEREQGRADDQPCRAKPSAVHEPNEKTKSEGTNGVSRPLIRTARQTVVDRQTIRGGVVHLDSGVQANLDEDDKQSIASSKRSSRTKLAAVTSVKNGLQKRTLTKNKKIQFNRTRTHSGNKPLRSSEGCAKEPPRPATKEPVKVVKELREKEPVKLIEELPQTAAKEAVRVVKEYNGSSNMTAEKLERNSHQEQTIRKEVYLPHAGVEDPVKGKRQPSVCRDDSTELGSDHVNSGPEEYEGKTLTDILDTETDMVKYRNVLEKACRMARDMKLFYGYKVDERGQKLLNELTNVLSKGALDWDTDISLAIQPMRTENADLRRKVRILTLQLKEKTEEVETLEKHFGIGHSGLQQQLKMNRLEADLSSTKQVNLKLKEENTGYQQQLLKLETEKRELVQKLGNRETMKLDTAEGFLKENHRLRDEIKMMKQQKLADHRLKLDIEAELHTAKLNLTDKEKEVRKLQDLVKMLRCSMTKLLEDLQKTRGYPTVSTTTLSHDLQRLDTVIEKDSAPAEPDVTTHGVQPNATYPAIATSRACMTKATLAGGDNDRNILVRGRSPLRQDLLHGHKLTQADVQDKVTKFLQSQFEPVVEDPSNRLSLSSAQTEYQPYPGTSPLKHSAFNKLDPFIKDLIKKSLETHRGKSVSQQSQAGEDLSKETSAKMAGPVMSGPATTGVTVKEPTTNRLSLQSASECHETVSTAPTVRELLTPLAERVQRLRDMPVSSKVVRTLNFDQSPGLLGRHQVLVQSDRWDRVPYEGRSQVGQAQLQPLSPDEESSYIVDIGPELEQLDYEVTSEDVSTLESQNSGESNRKPSVPTENKTEVSRYSVTDYFKKYAGAAGGSLPVSGSHEVSQYTLSTAEDHGTEAGDNTTQKDVYKGTELDTSLSTIHGETISESTLGTLTSIDDQLFREGLARLDANIARVQMSLQKAKC